MNIKNQVNLLFIFFIQFAFHANSQIISEQMKKEKWYQPSCLRVQYAGQIGFISAGLGKVYLHDKLETDILFGTVPERKGGSRINILTLKQSYSPFQIKTKIERVHITPLMFGINFSYHYGDKYNKYQSEAYPEDYYWFMKGPRIGAFIGSEINLKMNSENCKSFSSVSLYYEIGTTDLELTSFSKNPEQFDFSNILNVALGAKVFMY